MKKTSAIVPLVILLAGGAWIISQFVVIGDLEERSDQLRMHLAAGAGEGGLSPSGGATPRSALNRDPVDWGEVAAQLRGNLGGSGYLRTNGRVVEGIRSMSFEELVAALEQVEAAELFKKDRELLEGSLRGAILGNYPKLGLTRFIHRAHDTGWDFPLAGTFAGLAEEDPEEAVTWVEAQLAAGAFASKEPGGAPMIPYRLLMRGFYATFVSAPEAAGRFLSAVPEEGRLKVLSSLSLGDLRDEEFLPWVSLVRTHLSPKDHLKAVTWPTMNWSDGDGAPMNRTEVEAYLAQIEPSAEELASCLLCVAGQPGSWRDSRADRRAFPEQLDSLRSWISDQAPDLVDQAIGKALATVCGRMSFPEVAELARSYHEASPADALLLPLLEDGKAMGHKDLSRSLAEKLSDDERRAEYLRKFE